MYTYSCDKTRFILRTGIHTRVRTLTAVTKPDILGSGITLEYIHTLTVVTKPASFWEVGFTLECVHLQLCQNPLNFEKWDLHSSTYPCSCDKTQYILRTRIHTSANLQFWLNPLRIHIGVHIIIAVTKPADFGELEFTLEYTYSCARYASFGELGFTLE